MDATEIIAQQQEQENSSVFFSTSGLNESGKTTGGIMNNGVNSKTGGKESNVSWIADYVRGADFEVYYVSLSSKYKSAMGFIWPLMAEGIYLEFGAMLVGVCCKSAMSMILNPSHLETSVYPSLAGESPILLLLYPLRCVIYPNLCCNPYLPCLFPTSQCTLSRPPYHIVILLDRFLSRT